MKLVVIREKATGAFKEARIVPITSENTGSRNLDWVTAAYILDEGRDVQDTANLALGVYLLAGPRTNRQNAEAQIYVPQLVLPQNYKPR
ncbi:MAG: hypothetical protein V4486_01170 [Patescibacteria group bacterium]